MFQSASTLLHSTTSNVSNPAPELQNLTVHDIDIINAVIDRAGPSATTFFTVFKAYSEVLKERGLDPQEVVYYGKLLKLGTLRGKNWGEKWELVKSQIGQTRPITPTDATSQTESELIPPTRTRRIQERDVGLASRQLKRAPLGEAGHLDKRRGRSSNSLRRSVKTDDLRKVDIFHPREDFLSSTVVHKTKVKLLPSATTSEEDGELSSPVPPSYKSTMVEPTQLPIPPKTDRKRSQIDTLFAGKKIISTPKERVKPAVDIDEAWKNIKMEQDEKYADEFRDNLLLSRCWDIWRQGYLWIINTHQQIQDARNMMFLRLFMQKWRDRLQARRNTEGQMVAHFSTRFLKRLFDVWKTKFKQKKQAAWKEDIRQKMKVVKRKTELRIKRDAWTKWQRVLLLQRAQKHYEIGLLYRSLGRWKGKLIRLDSFKEHADMFTKDTDFRLMNRVFHQWKRNTVLQHISLIVAQRVESRILANALDRWRKRMGQVHVADVFHDEQILKRAVNEWKTSLASKRGLEHRAERYITRKEVLLLRAIIRIWRIRMRGVKLQRFKEIMIIRDFWQKWRYRLSREEAQSDVANNFLTRTNTRLLAATLQRWLQILTTHRNAAAYAIKYDQAHLQSKLLVAWRMKLHDNLQMAKVARWANKYFATRNAWRAWLDALEERKKQKKLLVFKLAKLRRVFDIWKDRTRQVQYLRQCEAILREHLEKRVIRTTLTHWTNRVIEIKSRELDVTQQADMALLRAAWVKWKNTRQRHVEEVSLLENYLLLKREDVLRRAFYRWLTAKRAAEHRRLTHERKEGQLRQILIASAWERWRERFKEENLRPLEYQLIIDHQRHILQAAFKAWAFKTESLPAVKFHSKNLRAKFFKLWKNGMPNAIKAKKARETDRRKTLARYFRKWQQAYKTKTTLKAIERAKYLRLPKSPRQVPHIPRPRPLYSGTSLFPRRHLISSDDEDTHAGDTSVVRKPILPVQKARSEKSESHSEYAPSVARQSSPVRSIVSMPDHSSRSPALRRPVLVAKTAAESDRLWDAIRKVGQTRRPKNL